MEAQQLAQFRDVEVEEEASLHIYYILDCDVVVLALANEQSLDHHLFDHHPRT